MYRVRAVLPNFSVKVGVLGYMYGLVNHFCCNHGKLLRVRVLMESNNESVALDTLYYNYHGLYSLLWRIRSALAKQLRKAAHRYYRYNYRYSSSALITAKVWL